MIAGAHQPLAGTQTPLLTLSPGTVAKMVAAGGMVAPKGPAGSGVFFHGLMAHASAANLSPFTRYIVYLTCNRVENYIRRPTRPDYYANRDFTALAPLDADCLLRLAAGAAAAQ
jgi:ectoine hydroxylase